MNCVLFVGFKIGYIALKTLLESDATISHVFIEKEHRHEIEKYYDLITELCMSHNISCSYSNQSTEYYSKLSKIQVDYFFVFGYRRLISENILKLAQKASVACHFSYLPQYRGFAPVNWAVINGERESGITFFHLEGEMDSGDIVNQRKFYIGLHEDINEVLEKCYSLFREMFAEILVKFNNGTVDRIPQNHDDATYTCARSPEDGQIDWRENVESIYNLIRGVTYPFPGAFTFYNQKKLFIWSAEIIQLPKYVGVITGKIVKILPDKGVIVLVSDGALLVKDVQFENEERCTADTVIKSVRGKFGGDLANAVYY
ncbi:methionyl-tRNA formyltransferase [Paenibacillus silviterrae]|uniref:methionyl-tRNA formyltransferase n=1 Tax=Paenibacillus silviterrae TaxID=3242194 RepID=UPI0025438061|nr:methionyl-tRNA formyltransferase [Paenibacillus chinjuensis]